MVCVCRAPGSEMFNPMYCGSPVKGSRHSPKRGGGTPGVFRRFCVATGLQRARAGATGPIDRPPVCMCGEPLLPRPPRRRKLMVTQLNGATMRGSLLSSRKNEDRFFQAKVRVPAAAVLHDPGDKITCPVYVFGVADGHRGTACSQFIQDHIVGHLLKSSALSLPMGLVQNNPRAYRQVPLAKHLGRGLCEALGSITKDFETRAAVKGEVSGASVIVGLYCEGSLVIANVGNCQALYHGEVNGAPGVNVTALTPAHDASNDMELERFRQAGGVVDACGHFQGKLEASRVVGTVGVKNRAPLDTFLSHPELMQVDLRGDGTAAVKADPAGGVKGRGLGRNPVPPFLVLATNGVWKQAGAKQVKEEVKKGLRKIKSRRPGGNLGSVDFLIPQRTSSARSGSSGSSNNNLSSNLRSWNKRAGRASGTPTTGRGTKDGAGEDNTSDTDGELSDGSEVSDGEGEAHTVSLGTSNLAQGVVSLASDGMDDATAVVVVFG